MSDPTPRPSCAPRLFTAAALCVALCTPTPAALEDLLVSNRFGDEILAFDGETGAFLEVFADGGGLDNPVGLTFGPDGDLYVSAGNTDQVLRYDGETGAFVEVFADVLPLKSPRQLNFGPDGQLYVASAGNDRILRFDGATGDYLGVFALGGGLNGPTSFTFGPSGDLYVTSVATNRILRYDGATGEALGTFAVGLMNGPHDVSFGPDGLLYVTNAFNTRVNRYDGVTGTYVDLFLDDPELVNALGMTWELDGSLLIVNQGGDELRRYDGVSGALLEVFVSPASGGLDSPLFATRRPDPAGPTAHAPLPGLAGQESVFGVSGMRPGARVTLAVGLVPGVLRLPVCTDFAIGMLDPVVLADVIADESGAAIVRRYLPPASSGLTLLLAAVQFDGCLVSETVAWTVP